MIRPPPMAASSLVIIWFANDRRLVVAVLVLIVVVVGIARRHRVEDDGDDAPVDQTGSKILGDVQGHVGSCWMSRHSQVNAIRVAVKNKLHPFPTRSRFGLPQRHAPPSALPCAFFFFFFFFFFCMRSRAADRLDDCCSPTGRMDLRSEQRLCRSIPGTFCLKPNVIER